MNENTNDTIKNIVWELRRIVRYIYLDSREMVKRFGITGPQSLVIKCLYTSPKLLSSAELSRILRVTPSNVTGIIDRLEAKGLILRSKVPGDRRTNQIVLTDKGKEFGDFLPDPIEEKLMKGLSDLPPEKIHEIYSSLYKIIELIGEEEFDKASVDAINGRV